jgi:glycosyltransferase involved in cell wall biosynthesis
MSGTNSQVSLLTAGRDRPYALGLAAALAAAGAQFDFIGSDEVDSPELHTSQQIRFLNLRGDQSVEAGRLKKVFRVLAYYGRLIRYAFTAKPKIFHILWNNKFELFDRTALMLFYKLLGKKIVFTAHNVNAGARDANDSWLNRATLKFQYHRCDHIFLHTEKMRAELISSFSIPKNKASVIPFGINSTVPDTALTTTGARRRLGLGEREKVLLFFGNIAPYKGVEFLVDAFIEVARRAEHYRLIIAGRPKGSEAYWAGLQEKINASPVRGQIILKIEYVPDAETEIYFKAADVLVLPYTHIFQSGVLFLGYNFGLPVIAADVGALKDEIVAGETGFVFRPQDSSDLAMTIKKYFASDLYRDLDSKRRLIRDYANKRYSWTKVGEITCRVYSDLLVR